MKSKPFQERKLNRIEIINEAGILLVADLMLVMCNPLFDGPTRKTLGYCTIWLCGGIMVGNFGILIQEMLGVTLLEAKIKAD